MLKKKLTFFSKTPTLKKCINELLVGYEGCLKPEERGDVYILQNITDSLMNFVCFKEGDRIACKYI